MTVRAVFFDVGETLIDETRVWELWADHLGVPRFTFFGLLGSLIERGEDHGRIFELVRPGVDVEAERAKIVASGASYPFIVEDLYPDVMPCLRALKAKGYLLGVAGNSALRHERSLRELDLPVDLVTSAESLGAEKPSLEFFAKLTSALEVRPEELVYVGDRIDNDVVPAKEARLLAVFVRRGPWGILHSNRLEAKRADAIIDSLDELPDVLTGL